MSWENVGTMFRFHYGLSCKFVQYDFIFVEKRILHLSFVCVSICYWLDCMNRSPVSENSKLMSFGSNHRYIECIKFRDLASQPSHRLPSISCYSPLNLIWFYILLSTAAAFCFCFLVDMHVYQVLNALVH
jgi:hypothetical protein